MVIRHRVQEFDALSLSFERGKCRFKQPGNQTVLIHGNVYDVGLVGPEHAKGTHVGRRLGDDHVARIDEHRGDEVERLLRARGDNDVVGMGTNALERHDLCDVLAKPLVALARAVLQRRLTVLDDEPTHHLADLLQRKPADVRHAAGEGDDLGPRRHRKERTDLGGAHVVRAGGVRPEPWVEARSPRIRVSHERKFVTNATAYREVPGRDGLAPGSWGRLATQLTLAPASGAD